MTGTWLDRNRHFVFTVLLIITLGGASAFYWWRPAQTPVELVAPEITPSSIPMAILTPTPAPVRVYVTGAVANSDVYFLPAGSIVKDAIVAAGGLTPEADRERINQALELKDQQQIHVPRIGEGDPPPPVQGGPAPDPASGNASSGPGDRINLNTATLEELDALPGIGPAIAGRIIDYRKNNGNFKTVDEITQVSGIGKGTLAKFKDNVTVE
jgi:competence protein ComEA